MVQKRSMGGNHADWAPTEKCFSRLQYFSRAVGVSAVPRAHMDRVVGSEAEHTSDTELVSVPLMHESYRFHEYTKHGCSFVCDPCLTWTCRHCITPPHVCRTLRGAHADAVDALYRGDYRRRSDSESRADRMRIRPAPDRLVP